MTKVVRRRWLPRLTPHCPVGLVCCRVLGEISYLADRFPGSGAIMLGADCQVEKPAPHAVDKQSAERLWTVGEQLTKVLAKEGKL